MFQKDINMNKKGLSTKVKNKLQFIKAMKNVNRTIGIARNLYVKTKTITITNFIELHRNTHEKYSRDFIRKKVN